MKLIDSRVDKAREHFSAACAYSRQHDLEGSEALTKYGDHGPQVSGVIRDHFPEAVKTRLRALAHAITAATDAGYAARPYRVRFSTMVKLAKDVARRDGSGFYGPRAD